MADCPGSCNARAREAREAYEQAMTLYDPLNSAQERPQPPDIQPWAGEPVWCPPCSTLIMRRLAQLDYAVSIYQAYADGHRDAPDAPLVGGSSEAVSPSDAHDTAEDMAEMLVGWEAAYRKEMKWPAPYHSEDLATWTTECAAWLITHLHAILASPVAVDTGKEILSWHREIVSKAKAGKRKLRKPLRCPSCRELMLTWVEGDATVNCSSCHLVMGYDEYMAEVEQRSGATAA